MQRIRFLTAMAVGALVTEELEDDPRLRDASPYLVWEWLVVESFIRTKGDDSQHWGVPGAHVTRRALDQHGYLDARSYLKTSRIFGFHGVYVGWPWVSRAFDTTFQRPVAMKVLSKNGRLEG